MTNVAQFAKQELDILSSIYSDPDNPSIVDEFKDEIVNLCEKFGKSGQSGGSAPITASVLSQTIKDLLLFKPVAPIIDKEDEWVDVSEYNDGKQWFQNKRCPALFKGADNKPYYLDAIIWQGEEDWNTFTGHVYIDNKNFELIGSSQYVKFPFKPKSFYIDVVRIPISKEEAEKKNIHFIEDGYGECYYSVLKDTKQLDEVFNYYDKKGSK